MHGRFLIGRDSATSRAVAALERQAGAPAEPFDPAQVDDLPAPARRYLLQATYVPLRDGPAAR